MRSSRAESATARRHGRNTRRTPTSAMSPVTRGALPPAGPWRTWTRTPCPSHSIRSIGASRAGTRKEARVARAEPGIRGQATVDERGAEVRVDRAHPAEHDVAARIVPRLVEQVELDQPPVLEERPLQTERRALNDQLAAHGCGRHPRPPSRSSVVASGRPTTFDQLPLIDGTNASARPWIA